MLAPNRVGLPYHNYQGNNINNYRLKSCIFSEVDVLWITESKHTHVPKPFNGPRREE